MTENRRMFWNVIATYGRSLYSLALGLFTARWALNALGVSDYGLYGLVGGLTGFIEFFNWTLAAANSRFYAFSIGQARAAADKIAALEECRHWFNTALTIHTVIPVCLVAIGYPIGIWAVEHFLTIPTDRVHDCVIVFRCVCLSCLIGMMNVPFRAMYTAKQYIAELTIYSYVSSTLNAFFLYYMITHPGVWLSRYALWTCFIFIVPRVIICVRAMCIFPECRIRGAYMFNRQRLKEVTSYASWNFMGTICSILKNQGTSIVFNKFFGSHVNAAQQLGNSVDGHASTLSSALIGAFSPAITTAYGAGQFDRMRNLVFRSCKFGTLLALIFMVPLLAVMDDVLILWLENPPAYTAYLCSIALLSHLIGSATQGPTIAIAASGKIKEYNINILYLNILTLPLVLAVVFCGGGVYSVGIVLLLMTALLGVRRIYYAKRFAGISRMLWVKRVFVPLAITVCVSYPLAIVPRVFMASGFGRVCLTTAFAEIGLLICAWYVDMDDEERGFVLSKIHSFFCPKK